MDTIEATEYISGNDPWRVRKSSVVAYAVRASGTGEYIEIRLADSVTGDGNDMYFHGTEAEFLEAMKPGGVPLLEFGGRRRTKGEPPPPSPAPPCTLRGGTPIYLQEDGSFQYEDGTLVK